MSKKRASKKSAAKKNGTGPVARAWEIFGKNPKQARKDAVAAAVAAGINASTAKTQYQRWLHRGDK
jgi:hypothetical protein